MPFFVVEQPTVEPVSLNDLRAQCRIDEDFNEEDELLKTYIIAAREYCEEYTGRHYAEKTLGYLGKFPAGQGHLELTPNINEVLFIEYLDSAGGNTSISADDYIVDLVSICGAVVPLTDWPATKANHPQPVTIHFECGGGECKHVVKQAILLLASHWHQNREGSVIGVASKEAEYSVHSLLAGQRVVNL
ncbi:MAG: head-tail connector protein [Pseudomonadales bacterium]|nr:head-tail connector protein [Pseudomonadales bacterium]NRA15200.1 phage head-tail connector protein [Oceanospirillaceae bacterium]